MLGRNFGCIGGVDSDSDPEDIFSTRVENNNSSSDSFESSTSYDSEDDYRRERSSSNRKKGSDRKKRQDNSISSDDRRSVDSFNSDSSYSTAEEKDRREKEKIAKKKRRERQKKKEKKRKKSTKKKHQKLEEEKIIRNNVSETVNKNGEAAMYSTPLSDFPTTTIVVHIGQDSSLAEIEKSYVQQYSQSNRKSSSSSKIHFSLDDDLNEEENKTRVSIRSKKFNDLFDRSSHKVPLNKLFSDFIRKRMDIPATSIIAIDMLGFNNPFPYPVAVILRGYNYISGDIMVKQRTDVPIATYKYNQTICSDLYDSSRLKKLMSDGKRSSISNFDDSKLTKIFAFLPASTKKTYDTAGSSNSINGDCRPANRLVDMKEKMKSVPMLAAINMTANVLNQQFSIGKEYAEIIFQSSFHNAIDFFANFEDEDISGLAKEILADIENCDRIDRPTRKGSSMKNTWITGLNEENVLKFYTYLLKWTSEFPTINGMDFFAIPLTKNGKWTDLSNCNPVDLNPLVENMNVMKELMFGSDNEKLSSKRMLLEQFKYKLTLNLRFYHL